MADSEHEDAELEARERRRAFVVIRGGVDS
jgi:hypothetical protein